MSLETIINNEKSIPKKSFLSRLRNRITPYVLSLGILAGAYFSDLPKSFAEEKIKTEKENKKFKLPELLNLYADMGYAHGENYHFRTVDGVELKGRNFYDLTLGTSIFSHYKNIPILFNLNLSNLYDGLKSKSKLVFSSKYESNPFFTFSLGSFNSDSSYVLNEVFSYSRNFRSENIINCYSFSASLSRLYKNFAIKGICSFERKNSHYFLLKNIIEVDRKFNENIISLELSLLYTHKYGTPYISLYNEIFSHPSDKYRINKKLLIFKTGVYFSTSETYRKFISIGKNIIPQSYIFSPANAE